jgi:hypothetical protein
MKIIKYLKAEVIFIKITMGLAVIVFIASFFSTTVHQNLALMSATVMIPSLIVMSIMVWQTDALRKENLDTKAVVDKNQRLIEKITDEVDKKQALVKRFANEVSPADPQKPVDVRILEYYRDELAHCTATFKYLHDEIEKMEAQGKNPIKEILDQNTAVGKVAKEASDRTDKFIERIDSFEKELAC